MAQCSWGSAHEEEKEVLCSEAATLKKRGWWDGAMYQKITEGIPAG